VRHISLTGCMPHTAPVLDLARTPEELVSKSAADRLRSYWGHFAPMKLGMHRTGEELVFAPARDRDELCTYFELERLKT